MNVFYRCHTGYIVNMTYVTSIQKDCAILNSNVTVPVSRYKKKKFQMLFTDFCVILFLISKSPERSINLQGSHTLHILTYEIISNSTLPYNIYQSIRTHDCSIQIFWFHIKWHIPHCIIWCTCKTCHFHDLLWFHFLDS